MAVRILVDPFDARSSQAIGPESALLLGNGQSMQESGADGDF